MKNPKRFRFCFRYVDVTIVTGTCFLSLTISHFKLLFRLTLALMMIIQLLEPSNYILSGVRTSEKREPQPVQTKTLDLILNYPS